ncbi:MAG: histidinol-phosphate transaminase [Bacillota bacterium]
MVFDLKRVLRHDLENLAPYRVEPSKNGLLRLDANENPFDFPLFLQEEIYRQWRSGFFTRYPDDLAGELRKAISQFTGVPVEGIIAGNGSDELILNLCLAVGNGAQVAIATPTFSMYRVNSLIAGAVPVEIPRLKAGFALDLDRLSEIAANEKTRLIFLCSPNNPTGNATPVADIAALLEHSRALVAVDEAYIDFGGVSCLPLLKKYENLILLRTFSKAFGLAGLRVGYLLGNPGVVRELLRVKQPFNLSTFAQVAACTVLAHREEFRKMTDAIRQSRDALGQELASLPGITVFPSEANFILFRTPRPAQEVFDRLRQEGVLVRNLHGPGLEECLRVTVGREEENQIFLEKMRKICF